MPYNGYKMTKKGVFEGFRGFLGVQGRSTPKGPKKA